MKTADNLGHNDRLSMKAKCSEMDTRHKHGSIEGRDRIFHHVDYPGMRASITDDGCVTSQSFYAIGRSHRHLRTE